MVKSIYRSGLLKRENQTNFQYDVIEMNLLFNNMVLRIMEEKCVSEIIHGIRQGMSSDRDQYPYASDKHE